MTIHTFDSVDAAHDFALSERIAGGRATLVLRDTAFEVWVWEN